MTAIVDDRDIDLQLQLGRLDLGARQDRPGTGECQLHPVADHQWACMGSGGAILETSPNALAAGTGL